MFLQHRKGRTLARHGQEVAVLIFLNLLHIWEQNQPLPPAWWPLVWQRSVNMEVKRGWRGWHRKGLWCSGPRPLSSISASGLETSMLSSFDCLAENGFKCIAYFILSLLLLLLFINFSLSPKCLVVLALTECSWLVFQIILPALNTAVSVFGSGDSPDYLRLIHTMVFIPVKKQDAVSGDKKLILICVK